MANLLSIAEQAWSQLFPRPGDEEAVDREDFVATAKAEYAYQLWLKMKADKRETGEVDVPSYLLSEASLEVVDDEMDISDLKIMRLDSEMWLQNVGGTNCQCVYVKTTLNSNKILCEDDSLPDDYRTYYPIGKKIKFPKGVHKTPLEIIYANNGQDVDENIEVDDAIGGVVRRSLIDIYAGKVGREDDQNDSNSNLRQ